MRARPFAALRYLNASGWTPDGKVLVLEELNPTFGIYTGSIADRKVTPLVQTRFTEGAAQVSPDGKWIVFEAEDLAI